MTKLELAIDGMTCGGCVRRVTSALARIEGVHVEDVAVGRARLAIDTEKTTVPEVVEALSKAGYPSREAPR